MICAVCGSSEPDGNRFCGGCGGRLDAPRVAAGRERKVVTVLFCDLVAFTAASDGADPEEIQARLSPYHARCRAVIEDFGGTVEKFIGDAVMAAFGAPVVHEDDPERAVRAGLGLLTAVEDLNRERHLRLSVRVGVATGEAVVTTSAQPERGEGMLAGDVVNTAARLQTAAPVGAVLVGGHTYDATRASIDYRPHDPVVAKGKTAPIPVWVAIGGRGAVGEDIADRSRPMIGRDDELTQLQRSYTRAVRESSVQLVTVIAEPGLGKSRLVQAFSDWVEEREDLVTWRQGRCPPYGNATAYAALSDVVKAQAAILDSDPPETLRAKLGAAVATLVEDSPLADQGSWLTARLAPLVGLPADEAPREELFTAWRRFLEALAATGPLVVVVEDLHWAESALVEFLTHLLEWAVDVPLVVITTARPELYDTAPTWASGHPNTVTLSLAPLGSEDTAHLVDSLLGTRVLPADVHAALVAKAAGNPLYAREYLAMLADQPEPGDDQTRAVELSATLPGSVLAVIAARLDTLPLESKQLLRAAAVIGHIFWSDALATVTGVEDGLVRARLHDLVRRDYLRPSRASRIAGLAEYAFAHALIADVAYGQLPRPDRAGYHRSIGDWYAARITNPDASRDAVVVAHHYTMAHTLLHGTDGHLAPTAASVTVEALAALAALWHTHAAGQSRATDVSTALTHARSAVDLTSADDPARADRLVLWGQLLHLAGRDTEAAAAFDQASRTAVESGNAITAAFADLHLHVPGIGGGLSGAETLREAAIATLERHGGGAELVEAYLARSETQLSVGRPREAMASAARAFEVLGPLGNDAPASLVCRAYVVRGYAHVWLADPQGQVDLAHALAIAEAHVLTGSLMEIAQGLAMWNFFNETAAAAVGYGESAVRTASLTGRKVSHLLASTNLVEILAVQGRLDEALAVCERAATEDRAVDSPRAWMGLRIYWAWVQVVRGHLDDAAAILSLALPGARVSTMDLRVSGLLVAAEWEWASAGHPRAGDPGPESAAAELHDLVADPDTHEVFALYLTRLARVLARDRRWDLLEHVIADTPAGTVFYDNNLLSARATLTYAQGDHARALTLFEQAAPAWAAYGYPLEQAHALIGASQCLAALHRPARLHLHTARDLLTTIGAQPQLAETERLLAALET